MPISFNGIPSTIYTPGQYIEFDGSRAIKGLPALPHVALIVAPRLTTGTAADLTPFLIGSETAGELGFGRGSVGSFMAKAYKKNDRYTELWGIGVADAGGGVAATGTLTLVGSTTAAGVLYLYIAGIRIPVSIATGQTVTQQAAAVITEMALTTYELPVSVAQVAGVLTFTALNKGTTGNDIDIRLNYNQGEVLPAGISSAAIVAMASGATDGSVSGAVTAMGDVQYHTIALAWSLDANMDLFEAELTTRWGPMEQREGHLFAACKGSQGAMTAFGNARNGLNSSLMGIGLSPSPTYAWAAAVSGISALQAQIDPFRAFTTLPIYGVLPPAKASVLTRSERNIVLSDGVSTYKVDAAGQCVIERLVTTYQTTNSIADPTYIDIMSVRGLAALRYTLRARIALKYPRHKLASNGTVFGPGQAIVTPDILKTETIALFMLWMEVGWVEGLEQFKTDLIVERNITDVNRVDSLLSPDIINNFMVYGAQIAFLL